MAKTYGGKWKTIESLSEGGQAHAYIVERLDSDDDETYVLKRLKDPNRIGRFRNEVEAGLKLRHKNIVEVVDWNLDDKQPYIVTVHCKGGNLAQAKPFEFSDNGRLLDLFGQICDGVLYAHGENVIHRDIKPDDIFLSKDRTGDTVVGDFGLCVIQDGERVTLSEEVVGARNYMATELEDGPPANPSRPVDVYSLGKLLYWLMSGGHIFSREKHRQPEFDLVRRDENVYMEHVKRLLDHMIVAEPEERWSLDRIRRQVVLTKRLVMGEYNPVGPDVAARCNYCGIGYYFLVGRDATSAAAADFIAPGRPTKWRILVCNECGHSETFRPDIAANLGHSDSTPWD